MTRAGTKLLADRPVHAQAMKLSRDGWRTVLSLPLACEELGEECPEWAWWLCEHAAAVTDGSPVELLEVLARAATTEDGTPVDLELAELGESLDLCEVIAITEDGEGRVQATAFGHAVVMLFGEVQPTDRLEGDDEDPDGT